jgi:hypothetical protein
VEGFNFSTEVSVRFAETDAQAIAHHASFVVWLEVARVEYLDKHAGGYLAIQAEGIEALTTEVHVRYHRAARFADRLRIWTRRPARRPLPLRVRDRASRRRRSRARRGRVHGARDGGHSDPQADPRPAVVRRGGR